MKRIEAIAEQINPSSPFYRFRFAFYNRVSDDTANYRKPENMSDQMFRDAMAKNPDKRSMVPVLAQGFDDLKKRRENQTAQRKAQEEKIQIITSHIEDRLIEQQLFQDKLNEYRLTLATNLKRILHILSRLEYLRRKSQPLNRNEEHLISQLERMKEELNRPGQYMTRLNELLSTAKIQSDIEANEILSLDEESITKIQDILSDFVVALSSIIKDINEDVKALNIIEKSFYDSLVSVKK